MATVWVTAQVVVGEADPESVEECLDCGFDAVLTWPLTFIHEFGVGPGGVVKQCMRCYEESP